MKLPPLFTVRVSVPTCPMCGQTIMEGFEYPVVKHSGLSTIQDFVCSAACAADYKLDNLRSRL